MKKMNQSNAVKFVNRSLYLGMFLTAIIITTSCESETPEAVNEDELITTVVTILESGTNTIRLESKDLDGDGPNPPVVSVSGPLNTNTVYTGSVSFLNELESPAEDITIEVFEEGGEHQVFYQAPSNFGSFEYDDVDENEKPIGLEFTFTTGSIATSGNLIVTLRHEPNKSASGVSGGSITNAGGSTDAEVSYPIEIKIFK